MRNFCLSVSVIVSAQVPIFPLNMCHIIIYNARWREKYLSKISLIRHTWLFVFFILIVLMNLQNNENICVLIFMKLSLRFWILKIFKFCWCNLNLMKSTGLCWNQAELTKIIHVGDLGYMIEYKLEISFLACTVIVRILIFLINQINKQTN